MSNRDETYIQDNVFSEIKTAIHEALNDMADEYIDEALAEFESELRKKKNESIIKILNGIELSSGFNPLTLSQDIHIVFKH